MATNPLAILRQRLLHGGGPFLAGRAFVTGAGVVELADLVFGHETETFAPKAYGDYLATSADVYICTRIRSQLLASLPLQLHKLRGGDKKHVTSGPLFELATKVNPYWTFSRLIEMTELSLCLWGKGFWFLDRGNRRTQPPREIWWARPDRVRVVPDTKNYVSHFLYRPNNSSQDLRFEREETIWFRYPNPIDEYEGLSPIAAARLAADTASAAMQSNRNLFVNGIQPGGFVMPKGATPWTKEQREQIESGLNRTAKGVVNAHRWGVFSQEIDTKQVSMSPKDAEFLGQLNWSLEEIARVFGIPLDLIGGRRTYQNRSEAERAIWTDTIQPEAAFIANELTEQLLPMFPGQADLAEFDLSEIEVLHEAETAAWDRWERQIKVGAVTVNEYRQEKGLDAVPWGDAWWAPLNLVPITDAEVEEPPEPEPVPAALQPGEPAQDADDDLAQEPRRATRAIAYGSPEHQQRWRAFVRRTEPWERTVGETTADLFRRQKAAVLARLRSERGTRSAAEVAENPFDRPRWTKAFRTAIRPVLTAMTEEIGQVALDDLGLGLSFDVQDPNVIRALERQAQRYGRIINETTWQQLTATLAEGVAAGEGIPALADRIETTMAARIRMSREAIARTEVTAAVSTADELSWTQAGVVRAKTWLSALDDRVRPTHVAAHGQTVPLGQDFHVGDATGPGPGQMSIADESVLCRCVLIPVVDTTPEPDRSASNGHRSEAEALLSVLADALR